MQCIKCGNTPVGAIFLLQSQDGWHCAHCTVQILDAKLVQLSKEKAELQDIILRLTDELKNHKEKL